MERMEHIERPDDLRRRVAAWRAEGWRIAFVPTMGNLHDGHLALVRAAQAAGTRIVASIFVNPLQFGANEDLDQYPRTPERDQQLLIDNGCDLLFTPSVRTMYPRGLEQQTRVEVPGLSDILCGANRPGHFVGVATVVCRLLNLVQPDRALFGEKDYQQLLIVRRLAEDLALPVEIRGVPTVRERDGLAMSSRNAYLTPEERALAPGLYRALTAAGVALRDGLAPEAVERDAMDDLRQSGFDPEYVSVRVPETLEPPRRFDEALAVLGAARLGRTRLIDNIRIRRQAPGNAN